MSKQPITRAKFTHAALRFVRYNEAYKEYTGHLIPSEHPVLPEVERIAIIRQRRLHLANLKSEVDEAYTEMLAYLEIFNAKREEALDLILKLGEVQ